MTKRETEILNSSLSIKKIEFIIRQLPPKNSQTQILLLVNSIKNLRKK